MKNPRTILMDYLSMRRSLGFKLRKEEEMLRGFISFFTAQKASYLTTKLALRWARKPKNTDPAWWTDRLSMLRGLARYWKTIDPRTEIPPVRLLIPYYKRPSPHIYTDKEITKILATARELLTKDNVTYWTLFGLLIVTGMRIGEALVLNDEDVDLKDGVITVQDAKLNKTRLLPLHSTTCRILRKYVQQRNQQYPRDKTTSFFVILDGKRLSHYMAWNTFKRLLIQAGLRTPSQQKGPRLHDLRHTFAVKALIEFYQEGQDIDRKIHALSTYLGHKGIRCTYWYLTAVPELMSLALARLEHKIGGGL